MFNLFKKKETPKPIIQKPKYEEIYIRILNQAHSDKFYGYYLKNDYLDLNDDYNLKAKELLDIYYYGDKVYKYLPLEIDEFTIEDNQIYAPINNINVFVGSIPKNKLKLVSEAVDKQLIFYAGQFKKITDEVYKDEHDHYFALIIKKEATEM